MPQASPREHARYSVDVRVDCSTRDVFLSSQVTNLSRGGLFIEGTNGLPVGTEVDLVLELPVPAERIRARGRVVWTFDMRKGSLRVIPGMGIKFVDLAPEDHHRLVDALARLGPGARLNPSAGAGAQAATT